MNTNHIITIRAEERPGLLHLITGLIEKRLLKITSCTLAATDLHDVVLITIELMATEEMVTTLALKLENIIEVFAVEVTRYEESVCLRAAWFKLDRAFLDTSAVSILNKYSAVIVNMYSNSFLVAKYGTDDTIQNLYNQLDGPYLLGFSQTGLITDSKLIGEDESSVISRLAA